MPRKAVEASNAKYNGDASKSKLVPFSGPKDAGRKSTRVLSTAAMNLREVSTGNHKAVRDLGWEIDARVHIRQDFDAINPRFRD